jgi:hypothetical protein
MSTCEPKKGNLILKSDKDPIFEAYKFPITTDLLIEMWW